MKQIDVVQLSDIVALRFECTQCHGSVSYPLDQAQRVNNLIMCPICGEGPVQHRHWGEWRAEFVRLANTLRVVGNAQEAPGPERPPFTLSFEIAIPDE